MKDVLNVHMVSDMLELDTDIHKEVIVYNTDMNFPLGGFFIYHKEKKSVNDNSSIFNGWCRQYEKGSK